MKIRLSSTSHYFKLLFVFYVITEVIFVNDVLDPAGLLVGNYRYRFAISERLNVIQSVLATQGLLRVPNERLISREDEVSICGKHVSVTTPAMEAIHFRSGRNFNRCSLTSLRFNPAGIGDVRGRGQWL